MKRKCLIIILICTFILLCFQEVSARKSIINGQRKLDNMSTALKVKLQNYPKKLSLSEILKVLYLPSTVDIVDIKNDSKESFSIQLRLQSIDSLIDEVKKAEAVYNFKKVDRVIIDNSKNENNAISLYINFDK